LIIGIVAVIMMRDKPGGNVQASNNDNPQIRVDPVNPNVGRSGRNNSNPNPNTIVVTPNPKTIVINPNPVQEPVVSELNAARTAKGGEFRLHAMAASPDGKYFASRDNNASTVALWNWTSNRPIRTFNTTGMDQGELAFSSDSKLIAAYGPRGIWLWNVDTGAIVFPYQAPNGNTVVGFNFTRDGKLLFALATTVNQAAVIRIVDLESLQAKRGQQKPLATLIGHTRGIKRVLITPDGEKAISFGEDGAMVSWDIGTSRQLRQFPAPLKAPKACALSNDGRFIISSHYEHMGHLWDVAKGTEIRILSGHKGEIEGISFSGDAKIAVTVGSDSKGIVWDLNDGTPLNELKGEGFMTCSVCAPNAAYAAAGNFGSCTLFWYNLPKKKRS
jgi:WD40 repeat protein